MILSRNGHRKHPRNFLPLYGKRRSLKSALETATSKYEQATSSHKEVKSLYVKLYQEYQVKWNEFRRSYRQRLRQPEYRQHRRTSIPDLQRAINDAWTENIQAHSDLQQTKTHFDEDRNILLTAKDVLTNFFAIQNAVVPPLIDHITISLKQKLNSTQLQLKSANGRLQWSVTRFWSAQDCREQWIRFDYKEAARRREEGKVALSIRSKKTAIKLLLSSFLDKVTSAKRNIRILKHRFS